ncbi:MAG: TerB family tellurite resistance protein [Crocinitomicaceae bacterium]
MTKEQEKKSILSELIELSKADGEVSEQEIGLIKQMGNMLGLTDQEILAIFEKPVSFDPPTSHFDRIIQFHRLVLLMNVDGKVSPAELRHLRFVGVKMGLNQQAIQEVLRKMYDFPNNLIPPEVLIDIYKKHMN